MIRRRYTFAVILGAGLVAACAPDFEQPLATFAPNGTEVKVPTIDNVFRIEQLEIVAGTTVTWRNGGRNEHNILPVDGPAVDWGVDVEAFAPGDEYSFTFLSPGTYRYYCSIHGTADEGMIGAVTVTEP